MLSVSVMFASEQIGNPNLTRAGADQASTALQSGGNQEGKDVRFGIGASALWATSTTVTSTGAVNAAHDSLTPLAGGMAMLNIALGEVVFGGVGVGVMGLLVFAILAVFIAGLMVGRTPEYLGKKIEGREMKLAMLAVLYFCVSALGVAAIAAVIPAGKDPILNAGPHGLSEILYATLSQTGNNGSAFAGITVSGKFWATAGGLMMIWGRFFFIIPCLALAASLGAQEGRAGVERDVPHHGADLRRPARRRDLHRRRPHVLPGVRARTHRRAVPHERRPSLLLNWMTS